MLFHGARHNKEMSESSSYAVAAFSFQDVIAVAISAAALGISLVSLWFTLSARRSQLHARFEAVGLIRITNVGTTPAWNLRAQVSIQDIFRAHPDRSQPDDAGRSFVEMSSWTEEFPVLSPGSSIVVEVPSFQRDVDPRYPNRITVQWHRSRRRWPFSKISNEFYSAGRVPGRSGKE